MISKDVWKGQEVEFYAGRIQFKAEDKFSETDIRSLLEKYTVVHFEPLIPERNVYLVEVELKPDQSTLSVCEELDKAPGIVWAEPDFANRTFQLVAAPLVYPNDPKLDDQWHLDNIGAPIAWGLPAGQGNNGVMIVVLDSGIQLDANGKLSHPDLKSDRIVLKENYITPGAALNDVCGHGTHVAGIVAADTNNGLGVAGINWSSPVHIYKVFDKDPTNKCVGPASAVVKGIYSSLNNALAAEVNVVINYSGGRSAPSQAYHDICQYLDDFNNSNIGRSQGILCAAAGNGNAQRIGVTPPCYPSNYSLNFPDSVVCVGASGSDDTRAVFSNYGDGLTVLAPGVNILSTIIGSSYECMDGTSMATPVVSGIISLTWSNNKTLSAAKVINTLKKYAVKLQDGVDHDPDWGYGRATVLWDDTYCIARLSIDQQQQSPTTYDLNLQITRINT